MAIVKVQRIFLRVVEGEATRNELEVMFVASKSHREVIA
jgi:hypothetical protein